MRTSLLASVIVTLVIANTVQAQKYPIRISSPDRVGEKFSLSTTGSRRQRMKVTQDGRIIKSQSTEMMVTFQGREEILALDGKGQAVRESFTVETFTQTEGGITTILLKPGSVVLTDGSQETPGQIVLKGGVIDDFSRTAFSLVLPPHKPGSFSDDEIYGTTEQKGVGDSWPFNKAAVVVDLNGAMVIPAERMSGTSWIVSKDTVDGDECLNLVTELKADGVSLTNVPAGFVSDSGTLLSAFGACVPTNTESRARKGSAETSSQFRVKGSPGTQAENITLETTQSQKIEFVALPYRP